jgi:hypothetical protein
MDRLPAMQLFAAVGAQGHEVVERCFDERLGKKLSVGDSAQQLGRDVDIGQRELLSETYAL